MIDALSKEDTALLVIDVQERLFPHIHERERLLSSLLKAVKGFSVFDIPMVLSEQVPAKMGKCLPELRNWMNGGEMWVKSCFSCIEDPDIKNRISVLNKKKLILIGIETHICVLQTARDLVRENFQVTVLRDAVSSRSLEDHNTALQEMRVFGVRISTVETVLFELLKDAQSAEFRKIRDIVK